MCHASKTVNAAVPSVEGRLDRRECEAAAFGHFECELARLLLQRFVRHDFVNKTQLKGFVSGNLRVAKPNLLGLLLADKVFQIPGPVTGIERSHHRSDLTEDRA